MNFLNIFEDRVSGIFGASRAPFSFKKLAKQAAHEMEDQTLVVNGVDTAPALYTILISQNDDVLLAQYYPQLTSEVSDFIKAQASKRKYTFVGEPLVRFMIDPALKPGKFSVFAENVDAPTLARLYEEERAYLAGNSQSFSSGPSAQAPRQAPANRNAFDQFPAEQRAAAPAADPFAPSVPPTVSRGALAGRNGAALGGAAAAQAPAAGGYAPQQPVGAGYAAAQPGQAAVGAAAGAAAGAVAGAAAAGVANNMVNSRAAQMQGTMAAQAQPQQQAPAQQRPAGPLAELADVVSGQVIPVTQPRCVIGRERASADVILRDPNVSRRHAELIYTGSGWSIEDLNSTNGTSVNNRRITRCPLRSGDLVTFGLTTFEFRG